MNCASSRLEPSTLSVLSQPDAQNIVQDAFTKIKSKSGVFLPSDSFYSGKPGPDMIQNMLNEIFRYFGIKHRGLTVHTDAQLDHYCTYFHEGHNAIATFGLPSLANPFVAGAAAAHIAAHHILIARQKIWHSQSEHNEVLADLATIHAGLGILVINGLSDKPELIGELAPENYIAECLDYFSEHQIVPSVWQSYISPQILKEFGIDSNFEPKLKIITSHEKVLRQKSNKLKFASVIILTILASYGLWSLTRPTMLSAEMISAKESIEILNMQYRTCEATVRHKLEKWDTSDIYMQRQIEEDKGRCVSIRNRHNYEVNQFNKQLPQD